MFSEQEQTRVLDALTVKVGQYYREIMAIHYDPTYLNPEHDKMKNAVRKFNEANAAVFRFKNAMREVAEVMNGD